MDNEIYKKLKNGLNNLIDQLEYDYDWNELRSVLNETIDKYNTDGRFKKDIQYIEDKIKQKNDLLDRNLNDMVKKRLGLDDDFSIGIYYSQDGKMIDPEQWHNSFKYCDKNDSRSSLNNKYEGYFDMELCIFIEKYDDSQSDDSEYHEVQFSYNQNYVPDYSSNKIYIESINCEHKLDIVGNLNKCVIIKTMIQILSNHHDYIDDKIINLSKNKINILIKTLNCELEKFEKLEHQVQSENNHQSEDDYQSEDDL